jgi:hypothetical protein
MTAPTICARIHARDFSRIDTLTIASVLPGVAPYYLDPDSDMECQTPQLSWDYVRFSHQHRVASIIFFERLRVV